MKKFIVFIAAICILFSNPLNGQNGKFEQAMGQQMQKLGTASNSEQFSEISNGFYRIAEAEKTRWEPYYNAAYTQLIAGFIAMGSDMNLAQTKVNQAQEYLAKINDMEKSADAKSEINVLEAYALIAKVNEDPINNGALYSEKVHQLLDRAMALNKTNPRALYLKGMYLYNTPSFYGGGAKAALPLLEAAKMLFMSNTPIPQLISWGSEDNQGLLTKAQAEVKK